MKIGVKLTVTMITISLLVLVSVGVTLLVQSRNYITEFSDEGAVATAKEYAAEFRNTFSSYWYTAETTAFILEEYEAIGLENRRRFLNKTLEHILQKYPNILGIWSIWEPDVLEGDDMLYLGTEGTNDAGRFAPYWYRIGNQTRVQTLNNFELPGQRNDYYQTAKQNIPGAVRDPFYITLAGRNFLASSITATIHNNGRVVGVIGVDFDLGLIQQTVQTLYPFGSGDFLHGIRYPAAFFLHIEG